MTCALYGKYIVTKADGSPTDPSAKYFVLRLDTDHAARVAVLAYAEEIRFQEPGLASDLIMLVADLLKSQHQEDANMIAAQTTSAQRPAIPEEPC